MIEAFNAMAAELASSRRRLERATHRSRAQAPGSRGPAPLHRDDPRARRDRRRLDRSRRAHRHGQLRGDAPARRRRRRRSGRPAVDVFARARSAADQRRARPGGARQDRRGRAGSGDRARRPRAARRGGGDAADRRRRRLRRHRARARRRDAAHPRAEGGGVARGGAAAGARDQEPADADPAVGRAHAAQARRSRRAARSELVQECTTTIIGEVEVAQEPGRRVLAVCADAGAARGRRPICISSLDDALALYNGPVRRRRVRAPLRRRRCRRCASIPSRCGAWSSTWSTTPSRRWIARGTIVARDRRTIRANSLVRVVVSRRRPGHSARASARSCSCRTTRPRGAAAGSAWRSCGASSPSTAAASK